MDISEALSIIGDSVAVCLVAATALYVWWKFR